MYFPHDSSFQARFLPLLVAALISVLTTHVLQNAEAQELTYSPYWFDGFNVSANSSDVNFEIDPNSGLNPPRQGGVDAPVTWLTNVNSYPPLDPNNPVNRDYKHQLFGPNPDPNLPSIQPLQLAEDATHPNNPGVGIIPTMVSPNHNFNGVLPNGDIIGKRITLSIDVATFVPAFVDPNATFTGFGYTFAGITVGGAAPLIDNSDSEAILNSQSPRERYSTSFIDDRFTFQEGFAGVQDINGPINDNTGCVGCFLKHYAGDELGILDVTIDIDDPNNDGNPWDGVGSTVITVSVNGDVLRRPNQGDAAWVYEIPNGGLTDNYLTLFGMHQTFIDNPSLAVHTFDNLTVWSAPAFAATEDADFDGDGVVTGLDFLIYQQNVGLSGQTDNSNGDANFDGVVGTADLAIWETQYGAAPLIADISTVPEPSCVFLLLFGTCCTMLSRPRTHEMN